MKFWNAFWRLCPRLLRDSLVRNGEQQRVGVLINRSSLLSLLCLLSASSSLYLVYSVVWSALEAHPIA